MIEQVLLERDSDDGDLVCLRLLSLRKYIRRDATIKGGGDQGDSDDDRQDTRATTRANGQGRQRSPTPLELVSFTMTPLPSRADSLPPPQDIDGEDEMENENEQVGNPEENVSETPHLGMRGLYRNR